MAEGGGLGVEVECPPTPPMAPFPGSPSPRSGPTPPTPPASPDSKCPICLGRVQDRSKTNTCFHTFCYTCILEWSKVKTECPLCKQSFRVIIHNIRSDQDYDEYVVPNPAPNPAWPAIQVRRWHDLLVPHLVRIPPHLRVHIRLTSRRPQPATSDYRRQLYEMDLWVRPLIDVTGRCRRTDPEFFREMPATTHRLIPWLNRELNAILINPAENMFVLELILALIQRCGIRSATFRNQLRPYLGRHANHFVHEFWEFARSVYDMTGFDTHAVYGPRPQTPPNLATIIEIDSDSSDSSSGVQLLSPEPQRSLSLENGGSPEHSHQDTPSLPISAPNSSSQGNKGQSSPQPGPSTAQDGQASCDRPAGFFWGEPYFLQDSSQDSDWMNGNNFPQPGTSSQEFPSLPSTSFQNPGPSSSSSHPLRPWHSPQNSEESDSEVQILECLKPQRERTPEVITLDSEDEEIPGREMNEEDIRVSACSSSSSAQVKAEVKFEDMDDGDSTPPRPVIRSHIVKAEHQHQAERKRRKTSGHENTDHGSCLKRQKSSSWADHGSRRKINRARLLLSPQDISSSSDCSSSQTPDTSKYYNVTKQSIALGYHLKKNSASSDSGSSSSSLDSDSDFPKKKKLRVKESERRKKHKKSSESKKKHKCPKKKKKKHKSRHKHSHHSSSDSGSETNYN